MRVKVYRTSDRNAQPCAGAVYEYGEWTPYEWCLGDGYTAESRAWFNAENTERALEPDTDTIRGYTWDGERETYEMREKVWYVDVPDLAALLAIVAAEGVVIVHQDGDGYKLEIYDDYRE